MSKTASAIPRGANDDSSETSNRAEVCSDYNNRHLNTDQYDDDDDLGADFTAPTIKRSIASRVTRSFVKLPWVAVKVYAVLCAQSFRWWLAAWQIAQIFICILKLLLIHFLCREAIIKPVSYVSRLFTAKGREKIRLLTQMSTCSQYSQWRALSARIDQLSDVSDWLKENGEGTHVDFRALRKHTRALKIARQSEDLRELAFLLRVCCHRNFCGLRSPMLYAYSFVSTKDSVEDFYNEVLRCLDYLDDYVTRGAAACSQSKSERSAEIMSSSGSEEGERTEGGVDGGAVDESHRNAGQPVATTEVMRLPAASPADGRGSASNRKYMQYVARRYDSMNSPNTSSKTQFAPPSATGEFTSAHYTQLISDLRLAMGRTALCLSGGGGLTVYHCGVVKTLILENLMPRVISGTSGGSIMAAMLATRSDAEILSLVNTADFLSQPGLSLAPTFFQQVRNLFGIGTLMDPVQFSATARLLVGEMTFADAFKKTGRFVSITTTRASAHAAGDPLVCNVINTPTVLVWSAMVASCALPLVLPPMSLLARGETSTARQGGRRGKNELGPMASKTDDELLTRPYAPGDMKFVDGSILQDIPVAELQTSFNVKSFLVSQVNPHFTPFIQDAAAYKEKERWFVSLVEKLWNYITLDLRNRYARLLVLAIVPHIKGQDVSPFLMQSAEGHCTIVPANPSDFCKLTSCPTVQQVRNAVICGQRKTWPYVKRIRHMTCIELKLRQLWQKQRRP